VFTASEPGGFGFSEANAELIKTENITSGVLLTGEQLNMKLLIMKILMQTLM
jgi:hypothetical protein